MIRFLKAAFFYNIIAVILEENDFLFTKRQIHQTGYHEKMFFHEQNNPDKKNVTGLQLMFNPIVILKRQHFRILFVDNKNSINLSQMLQLILKRDFMFFPN